MRQRIPRSVFVLIITVVGSFAFGMGGDHPAGKLAPNPNWPNGLLDLVNFDGRAHGHWVNANDEFFYKGDTAAFNRFLKLYGDLKDTPLTVVIHAGSKRASSLWGEKPRIDYDWKLLVLRRGWAPGAPEDAKRPKGKPGYVITVDVWLDKQVRLEELEVPKSIDLSSGGEIDAFIKAHQERQKA